MISSQFLSYLKTLQPADWSIKVSPKWTVKDVVAHMLGWEVEDAAVIPKTWATKEKPWFYLTEDYADFNQKAVARYRDLPPAQLVAEFERAQQRVQAEIDRIGADRLKTQPELFRWLFEEGDDSHYGHHLRRIQTAVSHKHN